ncbi:PilZ domain-containing protein [Oceanidesulfovibrio marinus]|uniref:PilZ domain-containing protein n=1 Tax=Oceanidesulfovibrio marinus TaxID=370038 RepID=A0ABX6NKJ8_9BACT|nr:PilZ domain-containing protein [Oceanidesulfovibrio marinus]
MAERPVLASAPDANGMVRVECPECGTSATLPAQHLARQAGPVSLRCQCGAVFPCELSTPVKNSPTPASDDAPEQNALPDSGQQHNSGTRVTNFVANPDGFVRISCPTCGAAKKVRSEKLMGMTQPVRMKCACGNEFLCRFNLNPSGDTLPARATGTSPYKVQTVFPDDDDRVHVSCPSCGVKRSVDYEKVKQHTRPVRTKCPACGFSFPVRFLPKEQDPSRHKRYEEQTFYADLGGRVTIICPECSKGRTLQSADLANVKQPTPVRCSCGAVFPCRFVFPEQNTDEEQKRLPDPDMDELRHAKTMQADELGHYIRKLGAELGPKTSASPPPLNPRSTVDLDRRDYRQAGENPSSGTTDDGIPEVEDVVEVEGVEPVYDEAAGPQSQPEPEQHDPFTVTQGFDDDWPLLSVNAEHKVQAPCIHCKRVNVLDLSSVNESVTAVRVNCECGEQYPVRLECRQTYRKRASLDGFYFDAEGDKQEMVVRDISLGGIGFHTREPHRLKPRDYIDVLFHLDDSKGTRIYRRVMVRNVRGRFVGCAFAEHRERDKELGFYLMP